MNRSLYGFSRSPSLGGRAPGLGGLLAGTTLSSGYPVSFSSYTAREPVQSGDVAVMFADGTVGWALPSTDPDAYMRPVSSTNDQTYVASALTNVGAGASGSPGLGQSEQIACQLANGNFVVAVVGGATPAASLTLKLTVYTPRGTVVASATVPTGTHGARDPWVTPLANGGLALVWSNYDDNLNQVAVYGPDLTVVADAAPVTPAGGLCYGLQALPAGGFVLLTCVGGNSLVQVLYSSAGAKVAHSTVHAAAPTSGGSGYSSFQGSNITPVGTGYAVAFSTSIQGLAFFTAAGVQSGATINLVAGANLYRETFACTLTNGNVAVVYSLDAATLALSVFTTAGARVGSECALTLTGSGGATVLRVRLAPMPDGKAGVLAFANGATYTGLIAAAPPATAALTYTWATGGPAGNDVSISAPAPLSDGTFALIVTQNGSVYYGRLSATLGFVTASAAVIETSGGGQSGPGVALALSTPNVPNNAVMFGAVWINATYVRFQSWLTLVSKRSPLGVAQGAAGATGAAVSVQLTGPAQTRLTFAPSLTINAQAASPIGQKMLLTGRLAQLQGLF